MNTAMLNISTDPETKKQLKAFASELGMPVSALMNATIKQMLRTGRVEFTTTLEPTPHLESIMREVNADIRTGKNISKAYSNVDDLFENLDKE